jgi:succinoglycan biosynthesis transport protein ExoP
MELQGLMREVKVKQEAFDIYLKKEEESRINEVLDRKGISNVNAIEHATAPQKPIRPRKLLNVVIGLLIGLVGGFGSAYVSEYMRRTFVTREEVEDALRRPVLAALPLVRPGTSDAVSFDLELRQAAQQVIRSYHERGLRTLLATSALRGEGRSHVAGALARVLAEQKFRVLLITFEAADSGKPTTDDGAAADKQGPDAGRLRQADPESTDLPLLHRLLVRHKEGTALEFAEHLAEVAKTMRDRFDLIVIDGPALTSFPEMRVAIAGIDGTILVIEAERTVSVAAARTTMSIEAAGGHLLGLVLNKRRYIIPDWIYGRWLAAGGREGV